MADLAGSRVITEDELDSTTLGTAIEEILVPSPNVAEGHQFKNALLMADLAGSRVITEDELDSTTLGTAIEEILGNESLMAEMSEKALKAAKPNASAAIVEHILSLVNFSAEKRGKN
ncbi:UDP-N-acetylglucosamine--N-acetylmuramyl-pyrophosphoryl-undecaprenol N-acetylglucosamine transferase [Actinidia chinensis var. chinensis]|uniref:UDP-N-acetylglucosamine--N-acetylmuramyl-pyrophosphoryl-undecaprenol N-acetylglucosamine transferase n=1 Tax=Actinidia chinensis var. chinensis TaxID=1590841 RepID=A0A2R6PCE1_ACTCC|nr:UDP-N-acetylglucosamine--N-acetylmuramyl-pyrophosphoryl-undecaprenol N-acetylglucosamine transferase [Actinidia chinensis var. chinensis]